MYAKIWENLVLLVSKYYMNFWIGILGTLKFSAISVIFGTLLGTLIAFGKLSKSKILNMLLKIYTDFIRGTPLLLQLFFFYLFFPDIIGVDWSKQTCIIVALCINSSAYVSEIIRAGIQAVDPGQREAAKSLGMSDKNMMIKIIMPQAIKNILPAIGNELVMMVKETSLCSTFFLADVMTTTKTLQTSLYMTIEPLIIAGIIYFVLTSLLSKCVSLLEKRLSVSD